MGLHMGLSEGLPATLIADEAPPRLMGTAFGVFNLMTECCLRVLNAETAPKRFRVLSVRRYSPHTPRIAVTAQTEP